MRYLYQLKLVKMSEEDTLKLLEDEIINGKKDLLSNRILLV
jgi:hypothetical protein